VAASYDRLAELLASTPARGRAWTARARLPSPSPSVPGWAASCTAAIHP